MSGVDEKETWEPVSVIRTVYPLKMAKCAHDSKLTNINFCKWAKKYKKSVLKNIKMLAMLSEKFGANWNKPKFGFELPDNACHAYLLDKMNGNILWGDGTTKAGRDQWVQHPQTTPMRWSTATRIEKDTVPSRI